MMFILVVWVLLFGQLVISQSFEEIFQDILPKRLQNQYIEVNSLGIQQRLYANRYVKIEDLVTDLVGDPHYVNAFDFNKPFDYNYEDYEPSKLKSTTDLSQELEDGLYSELYGIYSKFNQIYEIVEGMNADDFVAVYDYIYGDQLPEEVFQSLGYGEEPLFNNIFDFNNGFEEEYNGKIEPFIPFIDLEDYQDKEEPEPEVQVMIFFSLIKIPLFIIKLIAKIIWLLIKLKKYLELIETKISLYIINLIKKICKIIMKIKKKVSQIIKGFKDLSLPYRIVKKIIAVTYLIIKRLRILSWELKDILYRYQWKLIFLIRHAEKKVLLYAIFFKECIYGKLDKPSKEDKIYEDFVNADDDYYDYDDYDYFKEFAYYMYLPNYKTKDQELQKAVEYIEDAKERKKQQELDEEEEYDDDDDDDDEDYMFDLKEEFGFDTVKLELGKNAYINESPKWKKMY